MWFRCGSSNVTEPDVGPQGQLQRAAAPPEPDVAGLVAETDGAAAPHPAYLS